MATKIRLSRGGAKKRPFYRIVVAHGDSPRDGRFIARLGHYNPLLPKDHPERVVIDVEAAKEWIGKGAQASDRVRRFLENAGAMEKPVRANLEKGKPGKKRVEREKEAAAKAEDLAAKAAAAAAAPAGDAPAEG